MSVHQKIQVILPTNTYMLHHRTLRQTHLCGALCQSIPQMPVSSTRISVKTEVICTRNVVVKDMIRHGEHGPADRSVPLHGQKIKHIFNFCPFYTFLVLYRNILLTTLQSDKVEVINFGHGESVVLIKFPKCFLSLFQR